MRYKVWFIGVIAVLGASNTVGLAQQARRGLEYVESVTGPCRGEYVAAPVRPARCVYFVGEAIALEFAFHNGSELIEAWHVGDLPMERAFQVTPQRVPDGAPIPQLRVFPNGELRADNVKTTADWSGSYKIPPGAVLSFRAALVPPPDSPPGVYELRIVPVADQNASPIFPTGMMLRYELRTVSTMADQAEVVRRRMMDGYKRESIEDMQAESERLLQLYPTSSAAYLVRAEIATRAGLLQDAVASLERARELVVTGQDRLYVSNAPPEEVRQSVEMFSRRLETVSNPAAVRAVH
jgi:hypothetical protein